MSLGKRRLKQEELFIPAADLAKGPGHPFYSKLNEVLATAGFDQFVERLCAKYVSGKGTTPYRSCRRRATTQGNENNPALPKTSTLSNHRCSTTAAAGRV